MTIVQNLFSNYEFTAVFRLCLAMLCGGYIGAERMRKKRPAGIKTHAIVALGACLAILTNEYLVVAGYIDVDMTRFASSVISGIGFLGAGTIMVNGRNQVTGLTTAAKIWLSSTLGIAVGAQFYIGVVTVILLLVFINKVFGKIDRNIQSNSKIMNIMTDVLSPEVITLLNKTIVESGCSIISNTINRQESLTGLDGVTTIQLSIYVGKTIRHVDLLNKLILIDGVLAVEEI